MSGMATATQSAHLKSACGSLGLLFRCWVQRQVSPGGVPQIKVRGSTPRWRLDCLNRDSICPDRSQHRKDRI